MVNGGKGVVAVSSVSNRSTQLNPVPSLHHAMYVLHACSSPWITDRTDPSGWFSTQPFSPRDLARSRAAYLKPTPWTLPCTLISYCLIIA